MRQDDLDVQPHLAAIWQAQTLTVLVVAARALAQRISAPAGSYKFWVVRSPYLSLLATATRLLSWCSSSPDWLSVVDGGVERD